MGRAPIEAREYCLCPRWHVGGLVVRAHECLHWVDGVEPHQGHELNIVVSLAPDQVDGAEPRNAPRLDAGDHFPRTTRPYTSALSLVVQPRHTRQIMNPQPVIITVVLSSQRAACPQVSWMGLPGLAGVLGLVIECLPIDVRRPPLGLLPEAAKDLGQVVTEPSESIATAAPCGQGSDRCLAHRSHRALPACCGVSNPVMPACLFCQPVK